MGRGLSLIKEQITPAPGRRLKLSHTSIEGGNVMFFRLLGREGALIGSSSVIYSALYMEQKGLFSENVLKKMRAEPDKAAQTIVDFVLENIAKDLNIEPSNLLVIEHFNFHIDLEVLLDSDGKVFLYDPALAEQALKYAQQRGGSRAKILGGIFECQYQRISDYAKSGIFERNQKNLQKFGFQVIGVPGFFDFGGETGGQFLNGLFLEDSTHRKILLSTAATYAPLWSPELSSPYTHFIAEPFSLRMKEQGISVVYVDCQGSNHGGLHCLTREERKNWQLGVPQTIPIHSNSLPPVISTRFQIIRPQGNQQQISFLTRDSISGEVTHPRIEFDRFNICNMELSVPLEGCLEYFLRIDGKLLDEQECTILPGHPQVVNIDTTKWC
jgi:hypothetical protein